MGIPKQEFSLLMLPLVVVTLPMLAAGWAAAAPGTTVTADAAATSATTTTTTSAKASMPETSLCVASAFGPGDGMPKSGPSMWQSRRPGGPMRMNVTTWRAHHDNRE